MRDALRRQRDGLRAAWEDGLRWEVRRTAAAFLILALLAFGVCTVLPQLRTSLIEQVLSLTEGLDTSAENSALSPALLFASNLNACVLSMLYGLIPFLFLPALSLGLNAMLLGALAAWYASEGGSLLLYLAALLPHGPFEIAAMVYAFAVGLYLCGRLTDRLRGKSERPVSWRSCALLIVRSLLVLVPLLAISAALEVLVTPLLVSLAGG